MAETSWPFYGVETNETQFSKWARTLAHSGVHSGLALAPGSGMQVVLGAGSALVRGIYYENDANRALTVGAAPAAGQTRKDAVILRLDQTANTIIVAVKAGTANTSGGALPTLTQNETTWELLLATVTVASGTAAINADMISQTRPSTGLRVYPYITATRPTPSEEIAVGLNLTTKIIEVWSGGSWSDLTTLANIAGTLAVAKGGTGATTAAAARTSLGAAPISHTHTRSQITDFPATMPPSTHGHSLNDANMTGILPVVQGGTGSASAAAARTALGAAPTAHTHPWADVTGKPSTFAPAGHTHSAADVTSGTLAVARGGTGETSAKAALQALGIYIQPTAPSHKRGRVWIPGTAPD